MHPLISLELFPRPLDSIFPQHSQFHLFVLLVTAQSHFKIAQTSLDALLCDTEFAIMLTEKYHSVPRRVLWPNSLPENKRRCWMSLLWVLSALDSYIVGQSHLAVTIVEVHTHEMQYHLIYSSHYTLEAFPFPRSTIVWIHTTTSTPFVPSLPVRTLLMITFISSIFRANRITCWMYSYGFSNVLVSCAVWSTWANGAIADCQGFGTLDIKRDEPFLHQTRVSYQTPPNAYFSSRAPLLYDQHMVCTLYSMRSQSPSNQCHWASGSHNGLMSSYAEWGGNQATGAWWIFWNLTLDSRRWTIAWVVNVIDAHSHYLHIQLHSGRDKLDHKELDFSTTAAEYYRMTDDSRQLLSNIDYERGSE